jgi:hypothetical protein
MAFGSKKQAEALEEENARLKQWVAHLQGTDAVTLAAQVDAARVQLAQLEQQITQARSATSAAIAEEAAVRAQLAQDLDEVGIQEAGLYTFNHRLENAVAYKAALTDAQDRMKQMIGSGTAVEASTNWTVNNSLSEGRKMVSDASKLMLRAYNSEADNLVRTLRPHSLEGAKSRLAKSAAAIERLGKMMNIRITPYYQQLRNYELELTADYLLKKEQEKEAERERRAELRDQQKAAAEMKAALEKLSKERAHYGNLLAKLDPNTDAEAYAQAMAKLTEIDKSITGVEERAANIRTGHVYVISNVGAFGPDMVKIGMTRRLDPYDRVIELGDASVPFRFDVHAMIFHEDAVMLETELHQRLAAKKVNQVNQRREFFYATPSEVRELLTQIAGAHLVEFNERPEAMEWRASGSISRDTPTPARESDILGDLNEALAEDSTEDDLGDLDTTDDSSWPVDAQADDVIADTAAVTESLNISDPVTEDAIADAIDVAPEELGPPQTSPIDVVQTPQVTEPSEMPLPLPTPVNLPPADWYPDPHGIHRVRYWNGQEWTGHVSN